MKHFEKIHPHIEKILEERGLYKSLSDIFKKHRLLSFKVWRLFSFITLFPLCFMTAHLADNVFSIFSQGREIVGFAEHLLYYMFIISGFLFPVAITTTFLTEYLPLYKLSQKTFFKKHLEKIFRKSTTIASSCDTMNYKEQSILKYSQDKELNLAMSSYYQYLLEFNFPTETKNSIISKRDNLLNIQLRPDIYQKKFVNTVIQFIQDFQFYSTCPIVIKNCYEKEILNYTDTILSISDKKNDILQEEFSDSIKNCHKEKNKKAFKDLL